jgi:TetR/AcrR family transcriptional regulator
VTAPVRYVGPVPDQDAPAVGRRELRRQEKIASLVAAAHRLVEAQGDQFTTQDLIDEADVALQTFYRYFSGKDELFLAVVRELIAAHCARLGERAAGLDGPVERLRFYVTDTVTAMISDPGRTGPRFITTQHWRLQETHGAALAEAHRPFAELLQRELEAAAAVGTLSSPDPGFDAWLMTKLVMSVVHQHAFADIPPDAGRVAEGVWRFCASAVGGEP